MIPEPKTAHQTWRVTRFAALAVVACAGCTHIWWPDVTVKKLQAADDARDRYELLCPPGALCNREEKRLCPLGFDRVEAQRADAEVITCWTEVPEDPCVKAKVRATDSMSRRE